MATRFFGGNGAQIIPPHDAEIAQRIDAIASIDEIPLGSTEGASLAHIEASYLEDLRDLPPHRESPREFDIAYTALHGVGQDVALKALSQAGFERVHGVPEQANPDGGIPDGFVSEPRGRRRNGYGARSGSKGRRGVDPRQ